MKIDKLMDKIKEFQDDGDAFVVRIFVQGDDASIVEFQRVAKQ